MEKSSRVTGSSADKERCLDPIAEDLEVGFGALARGLQLFPEETSNTFCPRLGVQEFFLSWATTSSNLHGLGDCFQFR